MQMSSAGAFKSIVRLAQLGSPHFLNKLPRKRIASCHLCCRSSMNDSLRGTMREMSMEAPVLARECGGTYEDAVKTLNTLQSNAATIEKSRAERDQRRHLSLPDTINTAKRVGISLSDIDTLGVIHVTGTKGKGSTCAFTESILRTYGFKTGFFSSPHLVEVRERIRINGQPLSRDKFSHYFWTCYQNLINTKDDYGGNMPPYFRFLTILAFHVFLKEKVDVAIMEVGIGGEYDCTNIVQTPVVCGVTSLGIDHVSLLGDTVEKIAWHKGGIFKPGVPAVTVPQPDQSLEVLQDRAWERGCPLYVVPSDVRSYDCGDFPLHLGIPGEKQEVNASLALQLAQIWLKNHSKSTFERQALYSEYQNKCLPRDQYLLPAENITITDPLRQGLTDCWWPGRCQTLSKPGISYFLDGAHTPGSIEVCSHWFIEASRKEERQKIGKVVRVLVFNATGDRKPSSLLQPLLACNFDCAVFCPNIASSVDLNKADQTNFMVTNSSQLSRCRENQKAWMELQRVQVTAPSSTDTMHVKIGSPTKRRRMKSGSVTSISDVVPQVSNQDLTDFPVRKSINGNHDSQKHSGNEGNFDVASSNHPENGLNGDSAKNPPTGNGFNGNLLTQNHFAGNMSTPNLSRTNGTSGSVYETININSQADTCCKTVTFNCILGALSWISQGRDPTIIPSESDIPALTLLKEADHIQVLCTGSLHLVGGILGLVQPDVCE